MAEANTWKLQQLGGDRKLLSLNDWSAPYGRPYQKAVVRDGITLRHKSVRYPGTNIPPTRHLFGINYSDIELNGRFRDRVLGKGGAQQQVEFVKSFLKDQQQLDISWGSAIHLTGIMSEFDPGRESPGEIEWKMKILVDQDNIALTQVAPNTIKTPSALVDSISQKLQPMIALPSRPESENGLQGNILDVLDDLVRGVTGALGTLTRIANAIDNFESSLANEAKTLIAGIHSVKTAVLRTIDTLTNTVNDVYLIRDSAADDVNFQQSMNDVVTQAYISLALLSDLETQAQASERGNATISVRANQGDTWESLSNRIFGGPQEADNLRKANGAKYGSKPRAGALIIVPTL